MDEQLQRDINAILHQFELMSNAQETGQGRAMARGEDPAPLGGRRPESQPPPPPIIVYLVDAPPSGAYDDSDQDDSPETGADEQDTPRNIVESLLERDHGHSAPKDEATSSRIDNDRSEEPAAGAVVPPLPTPPAPISLVARPRPKGKRGVLVGVLCVLLVGAALSAYLLSPLTASAAVTIVPESREISTTTTFSVITGGPANPAHRHEVPGRLLSWLTLSQARTVLTTGTGHQDAQAAHGMVTFYNASLAMQTVSAGTVLVGADGVEVVTDQDAMLPAGSLSTNGQVTVPAHAVIVGPGGNIYPGRRHLRSLLPTERLCAEQQRFSGRAKCPLVSHGNPSGRERDDSRAQDQSRRERPGSAGSPGTS